MMKNPKKTLLAENGIVVGNVVNKQSLKNPISRLLVKNFNKTVVQLTGKVSPVSILEVGCGEGIVTKILLESTLSKIHSIDISDIVISQARKSVNSERVNFEKRSIYDLKDKEKYGADLVVCCEVMEHLLEPEEALKKLAFLASPYCLFSVPREPLWRLLNLLRGVYIKKLGNTPGHVQHWSKRSFRRFVRPFFTIIETATPLPWTFLLCRVKE
jgi:2-polyprenyl-3-methyl-5-hydroxy-6-metoxy-1,4-benzoquinol methylase